MLPELVMIKGAGDLASGIAHRLKSANFKIIMLELPRPMVVRTTVSFASAVYEKIVTVESVQALLCDDYEQAGKAIDSGSIAVLIDPKGRAVNHYKPPVLIDAIMAKGNRITSIDEAELVIGIGPGFTAGKDVHAVIETQRGHDLGKVIYSGSAAENTGAPGFVAGYDLERLLRSPVDGIFKPLASIGDLVNKGDTVAEVDGQKILAELDGMVRGMLYPGLAVHKGMKVGDIDPRGDSVDYKTISDKARAIGGAVLEAILHRYNSPGI